MQSHPVYMLDCSRSIEKITS